MGRLYLRLGHQRDAVLVLGMLFPAFLLCMMLMMPRAALSLLPTLMISFALVCITWMTLIWVAELASSPKCSRMVVRGLVKMMPRQAVTAVLAVTPCVVLVLIPVMVGILPLPRC